MWFFSLFFSSKLRSQVLITLVRIFVNSDNIFWPENHINRSSALKSRSVSKVSKFQNQFMKSSFLPKYERKNFCSYFGRNDDFINSFWNLLTFKRRTCLFKSSLLHKNVSLFTMTFGEKVLTLFGSAKFTKLTLMTCVFFHELFFTCFFNDLSTLQAVGRSENPGVPVLFGGHNLPYPTVEIGSTDLPKF